MLRSFSVLVLVAFGLGACSGSEPPAPGTGGSGGSGGTGGAGGTGGSRDPFAAGPPVEQEILAALDDLSAPEVVITTEETAENRR